MSLPMRKPTDLEIIDRLGGVEAVRGLCAFHVTAAAVKSWSYRGIPIAWRCYLELLKPDAFRMVPR
jgi:hypothetical protein